MNAAFEKLKELQHEAELRQRELDVIKNFDNAIIKSNNIESFNYYINKTDKINEVIDSMYTPQSWFKSDKDESNILAFLISNRIYIENYHVNCDVAIKILSSLINFDLYANRKHTYTFVPDKYLVRRSQTSYSIIANIMNLFSDFKFLYLRTTKEGVQYKLNWEYLYNDKYLRTRARHYYKRDIRCIDQCSNEGSIYRLPFNKRVLNSKLNEMILGLTLAYNELASLKDGNDLKIKDKNTNNILERLYNYRCPERINHYTKNYTYFLYCEAPVHIISAICNVEEESIYNKLNHMCMRSDYIDRHSLVYGDEQLGANEKVSKNTSKPLHLFENSFKDYRSFPLNHYTTLYDYENKVSLEDTHPLVTKYSYMIFIENFSNSHMYKSIQKHYKYYVDLILQFFKFTSKNTLDIIYKHLENEKITADNVRFHKMNPLLYTSEASQNAYGNSIYTKQVLLGQKTSCNLFTGIEYKKRKVPRVKLYEKAKIEVIDPETKQLKTEYVDRSIESVCKFYRKLLNTQLASSIDHFKYYIDEYHHVLDYLAQRLYDMWKTFKTDDDYDVAQYYGTALAKSVKVLKYFNLYNDEVINRFDDIAAQKNAYLYETEHNSNPYNALENNKNALSNLFINSSFEEVFENGKSIVDNVKDETVDEEYFNKLFIAM